MTTDGGIKKHLPSVVRFRQAAPQVEAATAASDTGVSVELPSRQQEFLDKLSGPEFAFPRYSAGILP